MKSKRIRWILVVVWMAGIFFFSAQSNVGFGLSSGWEVVAHILGHAFEFGVLAWLVLYAFGGVTRRTIMYALVVVFAYALTDEWHQSFVPGRYASGWDIAVDMLGAITILTGRPLFR